MASAVSWLRETTGMNLIEARSALRRIIADKTLAARGTLSTHGEFGPIPKSVWPSGPIDWDTNQVGKYHNVKVNESQLEQFICQFRETARVSGGADAGSVKADPHQTGGQDRPTLEGLRKRGEPKPETKARWKEDHESVVHFLNTEPTVKKAAEKSALGTGRPATTIARNYRRHKRDHLERQNGKTSNA